MTMGGGWLGLLLGATGGARSGDAVRSKASRPLSCNQNKPRSTRIICGFVFKFSINLNNIR